MSSKLTFTVSSLCLVVAIGCDAGSKPNAASPAGSPSQPAASATPTSASAANGSDAPAAKSSNSASTAAAGGAAPSLPGTPPSAATPSSPAAMAPATPAMPPSAATPSSPAATTPASSSRAMADAQEGVPTEPCDLHTKWAGDEYCIKPPPPDKGFQIHIGPTNYDNPEPKYVNQPGAETNEEFPAT